MRRTDGRSTSACVELRASQLKIQEGKGEFGFCEVLSYGPSKTSSQDQKTKTKIQVPGLFLTIMSQLNYIRACASQITDIYDLRLVDGDDDNEIMCLSNLPRITNTSYLKKKNYNKETYDKRNKLIIFVP